MTSYEPSLGTERQKHLNPQIGLLGEKFIQTRLEFGDRFDEAWDAWQLFYTELKFIAIDCPEVRYYDDRRIFSTEDRLCIRRQANAAFGKRISSADVSRLATAAQSITMRVQRRTYRMDRDAVKAFLDEMADYNEIEGNLELATLIRSDDAFLQLVTTIENFASEHKLWEVHPKKVLAMWKESLTSNGD